MKIRSLLRKLFKGNKGGAKLPSIPSNKVATVHRLEIPIDNPGATKEFMNSDEFKKAIGNEKVLEIMKQIEGAIPSIRNQKEINEDQIQIDSVALLVMLMTSGYEPLQVLYLIAKLYGSIMASAPQEIGLNNEGKVITPDKVEQNFIDLCRQQRKSYTDIHNKVFGGNNENLGKGTIH